MRSITLDEVKKLSAKHGMTVEKAVQVLEKDGWSITGRKDEDPLAMASKKVKKDIEFRAKASKGKKGLVEFNVEYNSGGGWIAGKTRRMHPQLVKALAAAL